MSDITRPPEYEQQLGNRHDPYDRLQYCLADDVRQYAEDMEAEHAKLHRENARLRETIQDMVGHVLRGDMDPEDKVIIQQYAYEGGIDTDAALQPDELIDNLEEERDVYAMTAERWWRQARELKRELREAVRLLSKWRPLPDGYRESVDAFLARHKENT